MVYKFLRHEMETSVNYNAEDKTATLYTRDKAVMRKLDKLVKKAPDTYKCTEETEYSKIYEFPKRLISFRTPRVLTEEQRAALRERMAKAREERADITEEELEELEEELEEEIEENT